MRWIAALLAGGVLCSAQDARDVVRRSVEAQHVLDKIALNYTYVERQEQRELDGQGKVKRRQLRTFDITFTDGTPYRRLIERDDKPLAPAEEGQEREKLRKSIEQCQKETPQQRAARVSNWEIRRNRQREFLNEIADAFIFRMAGEEMVDGLGVYVIEGMPRPGYRPRTPNGRFLPKLKGRLWIDKRNYAMVKVEAEVIEALSIGWFVARIRPGTRFFLSQTRVNGEVWLPRVARIRLSARLGLVKRFDAEWEITFLDYKKFQSDSRVLSFEPGTK
jgi:hypothetical protein